MRKLFIFVLFLFGCSFEKYSRVEVSSNDIAAIKELEKPSEKNSDEGIYSNGVKEAVSNKNAPVHPDMPKAFQLMPHKAIYEIKLNPQKKLNDPTISNITGTGNIELIKTKEGWSYKLNLEVCIHYNDGTSTTIEKNIATWESPTEVSFYIENVNISSGEAEATNNAPEKSILQGGAELTEEKGWRVYFQKPEQDGFITNYNLDFPIGHLEKILHSIESKETTQKILSDQIVFDAAYEMQEPVRINSTITPCKEKKAHVKEDLLPSNKLWRVQESIYNLNSQSLEADYEGSAIEIFSTGIINTMETSWETAYGNIPVTLTLKELTVYE